MRRPLIEALTATQIYQDYARAFSEATGLPVALLPVDSWRLPHNGALAESPFCALVAGKSSKASVVCLKMLEKLLTAAAREPATIACEVGMCITAVPVKLGDQCVGYLQTGQVFRKQPTEAQFEQVQALTQEWGVAVGPRELREAFFKTQVVSAKQHEAIVKLLGIFSQHLSLLCNHVVVEQKNADLQAIRRAKEFIKEHQHERLTLGRVAKAVNRSRFYVCKQFKKVTGISYTDYLARVRVEKAKILLLNPNLRVAEIAFQVGFQSATHFNRKFKEIEAQSPTLYRAQVLGQ